MPKTNESMQIIVVGPTSSGKTLLIKSLARFYETKTNWETGEIPQHISTVGVDITTMNLRKHKSKIFLELKELGGQMAPIWSTYFKDCNGLMFVVDTSNPFHLSEAAVELGRCFKNADLKKECRILIVFTKSDVPSDKFNGAHLMNAMLLDNLIADRGKGSGIVEIVTDCSALNCTNYYKIIQWIERVAFY